MLSEAQKASVENEAFKEGLAKDRARRIKEGSVQAKRRAPEGAEATKAKEERRGDVLGAHRKSTLRASVE